MFNAHYEPLTFTLPAIHFDGVWAMLLDTAIGWLENRTEMKAGAKMPVAPRTLVLLEQVRK